MLSTLIKKSFTFYHGAKPMIKGSAFSFVMNMAGVALNFLFALVAGRYCGSAVWGNFTLALTVLHLAGVASRVGLDTVMVRIAAEEHSQNIGRVKDAYLKSTTIIFIASAVVFCLMFFFSDFIAMRFFNNAGLSPQLQIMSLAIIPMNLLFLNSESLKGIKLPVASSFFRNVVIFLFALPVLMTMLFFQEKESVTDSYMIAMAISWAISIFYWLKNISFLKIKREHWIKYKALVKQGIPMMLSSSLIYLMIWTDTLMLGIFRTEEEVGVYNVAFRVSMLLTIALVAVTGVIAPELAMHNSRNNKIELQNAIDKANRLIFWTTFPVAIVVVLFSVQFMKIFGGDFADGNIALILLVAGRVFFSLCGIRGIILPMLGKQNADQYISLTIVVIDIILNLIFIPLWGINGAAFSTMATTVIWTIITVVYLRKKMKLNVMYIPFAGRILRMKIV